MLLWLRLRLRLLLLQPLLLLLLSPAGCCGLLVLSCLYKPASVTEAVRCGVENTTDVCAAAKLPYLPVYGQHPAQPTLANLQTAAQK